MRESKRNETDRRKVSIPNEKEEISLELTDLNYLQPKQEPMTPNHRETAEKDKFYG